MVIGLNWDTFDAPGTFSNAMTKPVIACVGHGWPCSMSCMRQSRLSTRYLGICKRSSLVIPSGPTAAWVFFLRTSWIHCSYVIGAYSKDWLGGRRRSIANSTMGAQKSLGVFKWRSHLVFHSSENFWKSEGKSPISVSWLTTLWFWMPSMLSSQILSGSLWIIPFGLPSTITVLPFHSCEGKTSMEKSSGSICVTLDWVISTRACNGAGDSARRSWKITFGFSHLRCLAFWTRFLSNSFSYCRRFASTCLEMILAICGLGGIHGNSGSSVRIGLLCPPLTKIRWEPFRIDNALPKFITVCGNAVINVTTMGNSNIVH